MTIPLINLGLYQNIQGEWVQAPGVCKFYDLREAPKNDQIGELVSFPQLQKIAYTIHPYSVLFIYIQSYRLMRQLRYI